MKSLKKNYLPMRAAVCVAGLVLAAAVAGHVSGGAPKVHNQNSPRQADVLVKKTSYPDEPVQVARVKNKKGKIELGKSFRDDPAEPLREFMITVNNTSGKNVTHLEFILYFPRGGEGDDPSEPGYVFHFMFGVSPMSKYYPEARRLHPEKLIKKGEAFDLVLSGENYDHILKVLDAPGYPGKNRAVKFWLSQVGFEDGTTWSGGILYPAGEKEDEPGEQGYARGAPRARIFYQRLIDVSAGANAGRVRHSQSQVLD